MNPFQHLLPETKVRREMQAFLFLLIVDETQGKVTGRGDSEIVEYYLIEGLLYLGVRKRTDKKREMKRIGELKECEVRW